MVGKCCFMKSLDWWLISKYIQSAPKRFISKSIARATISLGANSARSSKLGINLVPSGRRSTAPSPRNASVNKKVPALG